MQCIQMHWRYCWPVWDAGKGAGLRAQPVVGALRCSAAYDARTDTLHSQERTDTFPKTLKCTENAGLTSCDECVIKTKSRRILIVYTETWLETAVHFCRRTHRFCCAWVPAFGLQVQDTNRAVLLTSVRASACGGYYQLYRPYPRPCTPSWGWR